MVHLYIGIYYSRKKKDTEIRQLESGILPSEDREKTTFENGAVLNGHRPEPLERAGGNTDRMEMVEAELRATPENEGGRIAEQNGKGASGAAEREIEEQPSMALASVNSQRPSNSGGPALLRGASGYWDGGRGKRYRQDG